MYDAQTRDKVCFGLYINQQHNDEPLFDKPIEIKITFFMPIPKPPKDKKPLSYHSNVPDIDNLCKFVFDAIKDIVIIDDRIICSLFAEKVYDKDPRTELTISEVV